MPTRIRVFVLAAVLSLVASLLAVGSPATAVSDRVAGSDRYATAVEVARRVGGGSLTGLDRIIVVSGEGFADGLAASGLAGFLDEGGRLGRTAILLTRAGSLPAVTAAAIRDAGVSAANVLVVGGPAAVSDLVLAAIGQAAGWGGAGENPVVRIAGADRYETAAAIVEYVTSLAGGVLPGSYRTVLVASGTDFPDALTGSGLAYRSGHLMVLSRPSSLPGAARDAIGGLGADCAVLLGGPAALSAAVGTQVASVIGDGGCGVERVGGANRFETAALIADRFATVNGMSSGVSLVSGVEFADALTVGPLAGGNRPVLLTGPTQLPAATTTWLGTRSFWLSEVVVVGGSNTIPPAVVDAANIATTPPINSGGATGGGATGGGGTGGGGGGGGTVGALGTGAAHSCLIDGESIWCWGLNSFGELGDGTSTGRPAPVTVTSVSGGFHNSLVTDVAGGDGHTCALRDGSVWCWGDNEGGQLGVDPATTQDGCTTPYSTPCSQTPVKVANGSDGFENNSVTAIAVGGAHTCALRSGAVYCWGSNNLGQLGAPSATDGHIPVKVANGSDGFENNSVTAIAVGGAHTCALRSGEVYCWGLNTLGFATFSPPTFTTPATGQLGHNVDESFSATPVKVVAGDGFANNAVSALSAGNRHTCAIEAGVAYCWGANINFSNTVTGQLGSGSTDARSMTPVKVAARGMFTNTSVSTIVARYLHTCAIEGGAAYCWGANFSGQLGDGSTAQSSTPVAVVDGDDGFGASDVQALSLGFAHSCALRAGTVYCWGTDTDWWGQQSGVLGNGTAIVDSSTPVAISYPVG